MGPTPTDQKEEPLKFKTPLGRAVGARLLEKEPEAFQQVLGEVGKSILLAAGSHLSNELAKLAIGDDNDQLDGGGGFGHKDRIDREEGVDDGSSSRDDIDEVDSTVVCPVLNCTDNPRFCLFEHHMAQRHSEISKK